MEVRRNDTTMINLHKKASLYTPGMVDGKGLMVSRDDSAYLIYFNVSKSANLC